ncbi:chloride channel protein CLC-f-like [Salvia splendens]|uniref:chloride channel protein CLC-f-like n=1 Tax=Salvia splendens TaxID=180675 RepID=UPI001C255D2C|nr:chloride channel protein CLC-f-like [Salvia splendens]
MVSIDCLLVVEDEDFLEGILTDGDFKRWLTKRFGDSSSSDSAEYAIFIFSPISNEIPFRYKSLFVNTCTISSILTRGISYNGRECGPLICYPDTDLTMAKQLMEAKGIKQLPVIKRAEDGQRERRRRKIAGVLYYDSIWTCLRDELYRQKSVTLHEEGDNGKLMITNGHQRQSV